MIISRIFGYFWEVSGGIRGKFDLMAMLVGPSGEKSSPRTRIPFGEILRRLEPTFGLFSGVLRAGKSKRGF